MSAARFDRLAEADILITALETVEDATERRKMTRAALAAIEAAAGDVVDRVRRLRAVQ